MKNIFPTLTIVHGYKIAGVYLHLMQRFARFKRGEMKTLIVILALVLVIGCSSVSASFPVGKHLLFFIMCRYILHIKTVLYLLKDL